MIFSGQRQRLLFTTSDCPNKFRRGSILVPTKGLAARGRPLICMHRVSHPAGEVLIAPAHGLRPHDERDWMDLIEECSRHATEEILSDLRGRSSAENETTLKWAARKRRRIFLKCACPHCVQADPVPEERLRNRPGGACVPSTSMPFRSQ